MTRAIDFLTYSSRSGSTFFATEVDRRYAVAVVPETQCTYHALSIRAGARLAPGAAAQMLDEDRQVYWLDDRALAMVRGGDALTPAELLHLVGEAWLRHTGVDDPGVPFLFKLGGALHVWSQVRSHLPRARAVDVVRDGRAVVSSTLRAEAPYLPGTTLSLGDPVRAALTWRRDVRTASALLADPRSGVLQVQYDSLVTDTAGTVERVARAWGWAPGGSASFAVHDAEAGIHGHVAQGGLEGRLDAWRDELAREDRIVVETLCAAELATVGATDLLDVPPAERRSVLRRARLRHAGVLARTGWQRARRIRSLDELRRKVAYRLRRARSSPGSRTP